MAGSEKVYRDLVLKVLTDSPGSVVYRDDIAEQVGKQPEQVAATIYSLRGDAANPVSKDIEVVVPGRAWRYVPNTRVTRAARTIQAAAAAGGSAPSDALDPHKPLTERVRNFFYQNPGRIVYIKELFEALSPNDEIDMSQLRVGIANAKQNHETFGIELSTVLAGRAWIYTPASTRPAAQVTASPTPVVEAPAPAPTPAPAAPKKPKIEAEADNLMLLEKLGKATDGALLVRDAEQIMYRLYPL